MTLAEVIERARERLDENLGINSQRYSEVDMRQRALECARWFVARSGCQYATFTITPAAYELLHDVPCDHIQTERVLWETDTGDIPLYATHTRELDATEGWWQRQTAPQSSAYFMLGLNRIALWPEPTASGESYVVHYQQDVYDSIAAVPTEYHEALVSGVVGLSLLADQKVAEGMEEYDAFRSALASYTRSRSSVDRVWSQA